MKSQANGMLKVALGILTDYLAAYPHDTMEVCRDRKRLTLLVEERGSGIFTLDLPALDGALTKALENGRLIVEGALSKRASPTIQVPRLFRGLWLRIFDSHGSLLEGVDPSAIFFLRCLLNVGKKAEVVCSPVRIQSVMKEYYNVERESRPPSLDWGNDLLGSGDACSFVDLLDHDSACIRSEQPELWVKPNFPGSEPSTAAILRRCQSNFDIFAQAIGEFEAEAISAYSRESSRGLGFRHGPGAVSDLTSKEYKYDFPTWSEKLGRLFPWRQFGTIGYRGKESEPIGSDPIPLSDLYSSPIYEEGSQESAVAFDGAIREDGPYLRQMLDQHRFEGLKDPRFQTEPALHSVHEPPSKLMAVPKTAKGPRLIAAEPTAHQWCQQLILRFLEERLSGLFDTNFVSFRHQELSRALVVRASLDRSLATVDLSSASDRLTCWVVERAFRKNRSLLEALHATRTRWVVDRVKDSPNYGDYFVTKKFATQGTAVTFPIQSIIFLIIALTACGFEAKSPEDFLCNKRFCKSLGRLRNKVRVFGDDIIIPSSGYAPLKTLLHLLGLKVNEDKSFVNGYFRESCGMDAYMGVDVTPIKSKVFEATGPQSRQSIVDYSNNLHQAGLWNAAKAAESMLPRWVVSNLPVGGIGCGGVGRASFCGERREHLRKRYNRRLHRDEYYTYGLNDRARIKPTNTYSGLLQYFAENPSPLTKWEHGVRGRPKVSDGLRWEPAY
jgi:hypothetical protein